MKKFITILVLAIVSINFAKSATTTTSVTRVKSGGAVVYKSESSDASEKAGELTSGDEVNMVKEGKARSLVKTNGGIKGWVDNGSIEMVKVTGGSTHNLKDVEVVGWLDNPSAVYILDNGNPDMNALPIDRSFSNEIVEPKDREQVERAYDEN